MRLRRRWTEHFVGRRRVFERIVGIDRSGVPRRLRKRRRKRLRTAKRVRRADAWNELRRERFRSFVRRFDAQFRRERRFCHADRAP